MIKYLLCLLAVGNVYGQAFTFNDLPWLASPTGITTNFTGAEYVWISSDLMTNVAVSGNWNDRIQNLAFLQGNAANRPTNSAQGIWFDDTHWLTNFMTTMGSNFAVGLILKIIDPTDSNGIHPGMIGNSYSGADGGGRLDLRFDSNNGYRIATSYGNFTPSPIGPSGKWSTTNVVFDLVFVQIMTNDNTYSIKSYTNGLVMLPLTAGGSVVSGNYFGSAAPQNGADGNLRFLALNNSRGTSAKMFLQEVWIWTNAPPGAASGNDIDPGVLAAFHTRAKTYYGVTP